LTVALDQVIDAAERFECDPSPLARRKDDEVLVRVPRADGDVWRWHDETRTVPAPAPVALDFHVSREAIDQLARSPGDARKVDVAFFLAPAVVGAPGERPSFTYMLVVVEPESHFILGSEMLQALDGMPKMWQHMPAKLLDLLVEAEFRPSHIRVASRRLYQILEPLAGELDMGITLHDQLPAIEDVKQSLLEFMSER